MQLYVVLVFAFSIVIVGTLAVVAVRVTMEGLHEESTTRDVVVASALPPTAIAMSRGDVEQLVEKRIQIERELLGRWVWRLVRDSRRNASTADLIKIEEKGNNIKRGRTSARTMRGLLVGGSSSGSSIYESKAIG